MSQKTCGNYVHFLCYPKCFGIYPHAPKVATVTGNPIRQWFDSTLGGSDSKASS